MKTYFISRHPGAVEWAARQGFGDAETVSHFDPAIVVRGDKVIGTLPVHLAAEVCARGGEYWHLVMSLPAEARGKELTADDMDSFGACIQKFKIEII